ncbi:Uncharacterised protein [Haemophilus parainfluenzae]|nr:Uncharacterised protein [Haemophilus parainfluenzae]
MASLATFKSFYDKDMDVYSIISEFIKDTLYKSKEPLDLEGVKGDLYRNYRFIIPISVIKTALSKMVKSGGVNRSGGKYTLISAQDLIRFLGIEKSNNDFTNIHQKIINSMISFIEKEEPSFEIIRGEIIDDFFKYITDPYVETRYQKYIAAFLSSIDSDNEVKNLIQQIKDGEVLLTGLSYQQDPNEIEIYKLRKDLTIYIDQELLFSSIGYNGELYREIFDDLLKFVDTINKIKGNKGKILLRYFSSTRQDIESYFYAAENLVTGSKIDRMLKVKNQAMINILRGAKEKSDIVSKKSSFFKFLKDKNILEDDNEIFDSIIDKEHKFNIYSEGMKNRFLSKSKENNEKDFFDYIRVLSMVNFIREGKSSGSLESIGAIFLTAKSALLGLTWDEDIHENDSDVPLVTSIDFMINRFWFKTQKNITDFKPISFDIALQAKLIVNSLINTNFSKVLNKLQVEFNDNSKSEDELKLELVAFRNIYDKVTSYEYLDFTLFDDDVFQREVDRIKANEKRLESLESDRKALKDIEEELSYYKNENKKLEDENKDNIVISKESLKKIIFNAIRIMIFVFLCAIFVYFDYIIKEYEAHSTFFNILGFLVGVLSFIVSILSESTRSCIKRIFLP